MFVFKAVVGACTMGGEIAHTIRKMPIRCERPARFGGS